MRGKLARQKRRAVARSQKNQRLERKAATVETTAAEQEFDRLMHEFRNERAEAIKDAQLAYENAVGAADRERRKAVQQADADYIDNRDKTIKRLATLKADAA